MLGNYLCSAKHAGLESFVPGGNVRTVEERIRRIFLHVDFESSSPSPSLGGWTVSLIALSVTTTTVVSIVVVAVVVTTERT